MLLLFYIIDQAIARIHRMTQNKQTFIHTVVIKDTVEEGLMDNVLKRKVKIKINPISFPPNPQIYDRIEKKWLIILNHAFYDIERTFQKRC